MGSACWLTCPGPGTMLSGRGQWMASLRSREVIEGYLKFVRWGKDDYPTRLKLKAYQGADVIIDPRFAFRPAGAGTAEGPG